jgi:Ca2+-binding RTX toxin-like protein
VAASNERYLWDYNQADNWNGGGLHFSNDYGFGLVDARAAVRLAESWTAQSTSANERSFHAAAGPGSGYGGGAHNEREFIPEPAMPVLGAPPPPFAAPLRYTFNMDGNVDLETVALNLQMFHQRISDVVIRLTSPEGTTSTLLNRPGLDQAEGGELDADDNVQGWTLTSNAFRGENGQGTWELQIWDTLNTAGVGDEGTVISATLNTFGSTPTTDTNYIYTDEFAAVNRASGMTRTRLFDTDGGIDTINASAVSTGVEIDLNPGRISFIAGSYVQVGDESDIEHAFGGDGADTISGNSLINQLRGNRGADFLAGRGEHDFLQGGAGDDVLAGGADGDILDGGDGFDFASYYDATAGVTVNLADRAQGTGDAQGDTFIGIEGLIGSAHPDSLYGDAKANDLRGGDGDVMDYLDGGGGPDTMRGGGGWDVYVVDELGDVVEELADQGYDTVHSRSTSHTLRENVEALEYVGPVYTAFHGVGNSLNNTITALSGDDILEGGAGSDTLIGYHPWWGAGGLYSGADTLDGGEDDDTLTGGDGFDTFKFGDGWDNDTITDFTVGQDRLDMTGVSGLTSFSQLQDHITDVSVPNTDPISSLLAPTINAARIEYAGNSIVLHGVRAADVTAESFVFASGAGEDSFDGTAFWGSTIDGGAGLDSVTYAAATSAIYVDLVRDGGYAEGLVGAGQTMHLTSIENVTGATGYMNYLHGDQHDNVLTGGDSFDWLTGRGGNNVIDGRGGVDLADYYETNAPAMIDLVAGKATHSTGVDTLIGIEQARGTNSADVFIGDGQDNYFHGMNGADLITGGAGADTLGGGADRDTFKFGDGWGADVLIDFVVGEDILDMTGVTGLASFGQLAVTDTAQGTTSHSAAIRSRST